MTKRAILWCGQVKEPRRARNEFGQQVEVGDAFEALDDSKIQCNGLDLAYQASLELGIASDEIHACVVSDDILPQGFNSARRHPATVAGLRRLVQSLEKRATIDDALLFVAVNHCGNGALATADPVDEMDDEQGTSERLTPNALDDCLRPLGGSQILVFATCYAGIFLPLAGRRDQRVVLAACKADEVYRVPRQGCAWSPFLDELFGAWCACALSDAVPRDTLSLDEAFARATDRLTQASSPNLPLRAGSASWPQVAG